MILSDIARVIRSKNAGPTLLTIDVLFADASDFARGKAALTTLVVAARFGGDPSEVSVLPVASARAIKIVLPRKLPAGGPGDRDVYGAQQHAPLLDVPV